MGTRTPILVVLCSVVAGCLDSSGIIYGDATQDDVVALDPPPFDFVDPASDDVPLVDPEDMAGDSTWPCTPELSPMPRLILGGITVSSGALGDPDFAEILALPTGQVWLAGRIVSSTTASDTPKLVYMMVNPATANPGGPYHYPLGGVTLDAHHPTVPLGDAVATVMPDVDGYEGNRMVLLVLDPPLEYPTPTAITGTDQYSRDPAAASSGDEMLAVWKQGNGTDSGSRLDYAVVSSTGEEASRGTAAGDGTAQIGEPALAWSGSGYGLAYFVHGGPGEDRVEFVELGADGAPDEGSKRSWAPAEADTLLAGWPSIGWNGSIYAILWEESEGISAENQAHLHLSTVGPGGAAPADMILDSSIEPATGNLSGGQRGMTELGWNGLQWGVVWVHESPAAGRRVWFFVLEPDGALALDPLLINPDAMQSANPDLAWIGDSTSTYWVFAWNEFSTVSDLHVLYARSYGCSL